MITYNFKDTNCKDFFNNIKEDLDFLKKVSSSDKYTSDDESDHE